MTPSVVTARSTKPTMVPDLQLRQPGSGLPEAVRDGAVRAGRRGRPIDLVLIQRVRDALVRLPDHALTQHYSEIPGDCLASPYEHRQIRAAAGEATPLRRVRAKDRSSQSEAAP
jgi:hypothetical protein